MVGTPRTPRRRSVRLFTLVVLVVTLGAACSATPSWVPIETAEGSLLVAADEAAAARANDSETSDTQTGDAPTELAFVDPDEPPAASEAFCTASANIWIHSAALNLLGSEASAEMTQVAMANVAEWLERASLFTGEDTTPERIAMRDAFAELQETVGVAFESDWASFQASTAYANHAAAMTYESGRDALVSFVNTRCESVRVGDMRGEAEARADELRTTFATSPSTLVASDSLPGLMIFTHSSGRLIASIPEAWDHEEGRGDAIVDLIASPDIERFLAGDALDGVRLELVDAPTIDDFRARIDETMVASSCTRTNDLLDNGTVRTNVTQSYSCADHGASIVGQYDEARGLGLIIQATFDRPEASRADLIRLATIANSALWS